MVGIFVNHTICMEGDDMHEEDRTGECTVKELIQNMLWGYRKNVAELRIPVSDVHHANVLVFITHLASMRMHDDFQRKIMLQESNPSTMEFVRFKLSKLWLGLINFWTRP